MQPNENHPKYADHTQLDRDRAKAALEAVQKPLAGNDKEKQKFRTFARKAPTMVLSCGLGQTFAFLAAKEKYKDAESKNGVSGALSEWLQKRKILGKGHPIDEIVKMAPMQYRHAEREALAFLSWLKRMSEIYLGETKEG